MTNNAEDEATIAALKRSQESVPADGPSRPLVRLSRILQGAYDLEPFQDFIERDVETPLRDLLTDILHWCDSEGVDFDACLSGAQWMVQTEKQEWGVS